MNVQLTLASTLSERNIAMALSHLIKRGGGAGPDGISLASIEDYWRANGEKIRSLATKGEYGLGIVSCRTVVSYNSRPRTIVTMNAVDKLLARAISQTLSEALDPGFSNNSHAYRPDRGIQTAVIQAAGYMQKGLEWVAEADIARFFDSISHDCLIKKLDQIAMDAPLIKLILAFIRARVEQNGYISVLSGGLLQGSPLSPVLSNIYMDDLDHKLERDGYSFCRYGDDIRIYCATQEAAADALKKLANIVHAERLQLQNEKCGVYASLNRRFLGFSFEKQGNEVLALRVNRQKNGIFRNWYVSSLRRIDHNYHLINDGVLTKKDFSLLFENEDGKKYIPVETVDSLNIYSNVVFTEGFFQFANQKGLRISFFDKYGNKIGGFIPQNERRSIKTELSQMHLLDDDKARLVLAKKLENACIFNLRANIRYYERQRHDEELVKIVSLLTKCLMDINECMDVTRLMMVEAHARQIYYSCINLIVKNDDFAFTKRTRRPPKDALNALISFGNTLLYQRFSSELSRSALNCRFGIVHMDMRRAENLNLDIADLFKPILVDRTIFTLINRRMLDAKRHFVEIEEGGIYLNKQAKITFIQEFENKLNNSVNISGKRYTYDQLIREEVRKLQKYFEIGEAYKPYKYVN